MIKLIKYLIKTNIYWFKQSSNTLDRKLDQLDKKMELVELAKLPQGIGRIEITTLRYNRDLNIRTLPTKESTVSSIVKSGSSIMIAIEIKHNGFVYSPSHRGWINMKYIN